MRPGLVWGSAHGPAGAVAIEDCDAPAPGFRWLHLNLSDHRTQHWIERSAKLPPQISALMLSHDDGQRAVVQKGVIGMVLHDFEREFDTARTSTIGALHLALGPELMLTGRFHPLRSADIVRRRIDDGVRVADPTDALELMLLTVAEGLDGLAGDMTAELLTAEEEFLVHGGLPDTRDLVAVRRRAAQIHRLIGGMRGALTRLDDDAATPAGLKPALARAQTRLHAVDGAVVAVQGQLRLLRDELDLQAAQRTNHNIYLLSMMSALLLPATLVTGFFGMNTGGLPLATGDNATALAGVAALAASAVTYIALKLFGFVR